MQFSAYEEPDSRRLAIQFKNIEIALDRPKGRYLKDIMAAKETVGMKDMTEKIGKMFKEKDRREATAQNNVDQLNQRIETIDYAERMSDKMTIYKGIVNVCNQYAWFCDLSFMICALTTKFTWNIHKFNRLMASFEAKIPKQTWPEKRTPIIARTTCACALLAIGIDAHLRTPGTYFTNWNLQATLRTTFYIMGKEYFKKNDPDGQKFCEMNRIITYIVSLKLTHFDVMHIFMTEPIPINILDLLETQKFMLSHPDNPTVCFTYISFNPSELKKEMRKRRRGCAQWW